MDNKTSGSNTFLAIALSIMVIVAWQFFYMGPKIERERLAAEKLAEQQAAQNPAPAPSGTPSVDSSIPKPQADGAVPGAPVQITSEMDRQAAISADQRVPLETESLIGSINLKGGRVDDLRLKKYRETVDDTSPMITLMSPSQSRNGYFAEFGYAQGANSGKVPDATTIWSVDGGNTLSENSPITLTYTNENNLTFKRQIEVDKDYMFTFTDTIENQSGESITASPYGRVVRYQKAEDTGISAILHQGPIGVFGEEGLQEIDYEDVEAELRTRPVETATDGWLGFTDKYWAATLVPTGQFKPSFSFVNQGRTRFQSDFLSDPVTVSAGSNAQVTHRLFAGAKGKEIIDNYETTLEIRLFDRLIDWGWLWWITRPMATLLNFLYGIVGNFGVAILAITVLVKAVFFPLANLSYASMAKMKKLQPEMTRIREVYSDDKAKQQQELMAMYKKEKINPAAGCWPILIQIPVFFALYKVLYVSIEMRHAPFFGWIQDLSAQDPTSIFNLFGLLPFGVPAFLMIGIWPLIMGITMFLQMKMNPAPPDPTQQMIFTWMPVIFTFMLATFPAGLVIYWAWNNTLSIIQQAVIMKRFGVKIELWDNIRSLFSRKKDTPAE